MVIQNARLFQPNGSFRAGDLFIEDGRFAASAGGEVLGADGLTAIPGLVDLHFHGCVGYDFCDGTPEAFAAITRYEASVG